MARLEPGRMRATYRKHSVVYQRNTLPRGTTNKIHPAKPDSMSGAVPLKRKVLM